MKMAILGSLRKKGCRNFALSKRKAYIAQTDKKLILFSQNMNKRLDGIPRSIIANYADIKMFDELRNQIERREKKVVVIFEVTSTVEGKAEYFKMGAAI